MRGKSFSLTNDDKRERKRGAHKKRTLPSILATKRPGEPYHSVGAPQNVKHQVHVNQDFNWDGDVTRHFTITKKLGEGAFGAVFLGRHADTGQMFAMKELAVNGEASALEEVRKEIDILRKCKHSNIVSYFGSMVRDNDVLFILMDYCDLGSLREVIEMTNMPLSEAETLQVSKCTLNGLVYLHAQGIIHRDVKGANILVNMKGEVKITDFGVSDVLGGSSAMIGSPYWMAPEVVSERPYDARCDVWSLGITVIEMRDGVPPMNDMHPMIAMRRVPTNAPPRLLCEDECSTQMVDFVAQCLIKDPRRRLRTMDLMLDPWLLQAAGPSVLRERLIVTLKERKKREKEERQEQQQQVNYHTVMIAREEEEEKEDEEEEEDKEEEDGGIFVECDTMVVVADQQEQDDDDDDDDDDGGMFVECDTMVVAQHEEQQQEGGDKNGPSTPNWKAIVAQMSSTDIAPSSPPTSALSESGRIRQDWSRARPQVSPAKALSPAMGQQGAAHRSPRSNRSSLHDAPPPRGPRQQSSFPGIKLRSDSVFDNAPALALRSDHSSLSDSSSSGSVSMVPPPLPSLPELHPSPPQERPPSLPRLPSTDSVIALPPFYQLVKERAPTKFAPFVDLMKRYKLGEVETADVAQRAKELFAATPEILAEFNAFLPKKHQMK